MKSEMKDIIKILIFAIPFTLCSCKTQDQAVSIRSALKDAIKEILLTEGDLQNTNRNLDWAIDGEGFFKVKLPDGQITFTRIGSFNIDRQGNIVTADCYLLAPQITVPQNISQIVVTPTGLVQGFDPSNPAIVQQLGQVQLTRFINPSGLVAIGNNLYKDSLNVENRMDSKPGDKGLGLIRQGFLEQSHIEMIKKVIALLRAQGSGADIRDSDEIMQAINSLKRSKN